MTTGRRQRSFAASQTGEFFERMFERNERLGTILRIAGLLSAPLSTEQLLELLMDGLSDLLNAERSTLYLLTADGDTLWSQVTQGEAMVRIQVRRGEGIAGWVATTGRTVNVKDVYQDPRFDPSWDRKHNFRTTSMLCQPIRDRDGNIIGVAQAINKLGDAYFDLDDEMMMRTIMAMAGIAIVNGDLYRSLLARNMELRQTQEDLHEKVRAMHLLFAIEREVAQAADVDGAIATLLVEMRKTVPCAVIQVSLRADSGSMLVHRLRAGAEAVEVQHFDRLVGYAGRTMRAGETLDVGALKSQTQLTLCEEEGLGVEPDSGLCVPLIAETEVIGALCLFERVTHNGGFMGDDRTLIELVADQTARVVARLLAREKAEREDRLAALGGALSGILHDFKTPMTIASGYAQLMARTDDADKRAEMAATVLKQLDRVTAMSRDVLGFARGTQDIFVQKVHLNDFATEVEELLGQIFGGTDIQAKVIARYRGVARFDKLKAMRVVQNLARNSRDALMHPDHMQKAAGRPQRFVLLIDRVEKEPMSEASMLLREALDQVPGSSTGGRSAGDGGAGDHVSGSSTKEAEQQLVLTFADTGPGVPPEFRHRMFEAFATQGKKDGTGLGLAMVKGFAEAHGGGVRYMDTPGGGATFEVRIALSTQTPSQALDLQ